jgi:hypothetical protein
VRRGGGGSPCDEAGAPRRAAPLNMPNRSSHARSPPKVIGHDLRMRADAGSVVVWHHNAPVNSLSFEDPWLASASSDGMVLMTNTEAAPPTRGGGSGAAAAAASARAGKRGGGGGAGAGGDGKVFSPGTRRNLPIAGGEPVFAVDIADQFLAAGGRRDVVAIWDFTAAEAAAARAAAAKAARTARRASGKRGARGGRGSGSAAGTPPAGGGGGAAAAPRSAPQPVALPAGAAARGGGGRRGGGGGSLEGPTPMSFSPRPRGGAAGSAGAATSAPCAPRAPPACGAQPPARHWAGSPRQGFFFDSGGSYGGPPAGPCGFPGGVASPSPPGRWGGGGAGRGGSSGGGAPARPPPPAAPLVAPCPVAAAASHAPGGGWGAGRSAARMTPLGRPGDAPQQPQPPPRRG